MAEGVRFGGYNRIFTAPAGRGDVENLHTFDNGKAIVSAWKLSDEELAEINRSRRVFVSVLTPGIFFPIFVGSESTVRSVVADYGTVWTREDPAHCNFDGCTAAGEVFPVITFGPKGWEADKPFPYRLEIPKRVCAAHTDAFDPRLYIGAGAEHGIRELIVSQNLAEPDFTVVNVEWRPITDQAFAELEGGGEARLWFA